VFLTFQYGLQPTRAQYRVLERILEGQRLLYNAALQERIEAWKKQAKSISGHDQRKSLTEIRGDDPNGYGALPANLSRWTLAKIEQAFSGFFKRVKVNKKKAGFPRFRSISRWNSFGFVEWSGIRLDGDTLDFKGLTGGLKVHLHRDLPFGATIKSCVFTKRDRHWVVSLQIEVPEVATVHRGVGNAIGLDWGVETFATLSNGDRIENPRLGTDAAAAVRIAARKLSRAKRGSRRRLKTKAHLARLQRRLVNRRRTHLHQVSAGLTKRFGYIAVEDLQIINMTASAKGTVEQPGTNVRQKAGLNREILDTSPSTLMAMLRYKAEKAGSVFVAVDAKNTSQECSGCGAKLQKDLSVRIHSCSHCNLEIHRDLNAARNILIRAVVGPWSGRVELPNDLAGDRRFVNLKAA